MDKNRDGTIASHELDSKAELAFKVKPFVLKFKKSHYLAFKVDRCLEI